MNLTYVDKKTQPLNTNNKYGIVFDWRNAKNNNSNEYSLYVGGNYFIARIKQYPDGSFHGSLNRPCDFYLHEKDLETLKRCLEGSILTFIDDVLSYGKDNK